MCMTPSTYVHARKNGPTYPDTLRWLRAGNARPGSSSCSSRPVETPARGRRRSRPGRGRCRSDRTGGMLGDGRSKSGRRSKCVLGYELVLLFYVLFSLTWSKYAVNLIFAGCLTPSSWKLAPWLTMAHLQPRWLKLHVPEITADALPCFFFCFFLDFRGVQKVNYPDRRWRNAAKSVLVAPRQRDCF